MEDKEGDDVVLCVLPPDDTDLCKAMNVPLANFVKGPEAFCFPSNH